ncbi:hypothetical protein HNY73_002127 [Argiope bruennichi]|uniref:Uncharacterized protein n=1 Tax=Argiope bruennichi TaxID=94029 RepID=A0A8T0FV16_ARGBR|nr:hypothetical protein HNY73_002127 [Argiope bruennichi]
MHVIGLKRKQRRKSPFSSEGNVHCFKQRPVSRGPKPANAHGASTQHGEFILLIFGGQHTPLRSANDTPQEVRGGKGSEDKEYLPPGPAETKSRRIERKRIKASVEGSIDDHSGSGLA